MARCPELIYIINILFYFYNIFFLFLAIKTLTLVNVKTQFILPPFYCVLMFRYRKKKTPQFYAFLWGSILNFLIYYCNKLKISVKSLLSALTVSFLDSANFSLRLPVITTFLAASGAFGASFKDLTSSRFFKTKGI